MMKFPHLMQPVTVRGKTYRNRILAAPTGFAAFLKTPFAAGTYSMLQERARGGQASVCLGEAMVSYPHGLSDDEGQIANGPFDVSGPDSPDFPLLKQAVELIQAEGALAIGELNHPGASGSPFGAFSHPLGPVARTREDGVQVEAFTPDSMEQVKQEFAAQAAFLKAAGFDGVLIHGGHGFLFTQFLSPLENTRADAYGGDPERRARFPLEILQRVRESVGEDFIIELRVSGSERLEGGITPELTADFCQRLEGLVDLVHVSSGHYYRSQRTLEFSSQYDPHGCNVPMASLIRSRIPKSILVGVVGGINSPEQGERILTSGAADFIILGRQMFADSAFAQKAAEGRSEDIQRCIRCMRCYPGSVEHPIEAAYNRRHPPVKPTPDLNAPFCSVNPQTRLFIAPALPAPASAPEPKRVLVIGGGPAGLSAARFLADAGHSVTLAEACETLGGTLWFTDADPYKEDLRQFRDLLIRRVRERPVQVLLDARITPENVASFQADRVVAAIGGSARTPAIPGIQYAIPALETYRAEFVPGRRVVMVGGGLVGCDTAVCLAARGSHVTIIEPLERVATESSCMAFTSLMDQLDRLGVHCLTNCLCTEITPNGVWYKSEGTAYFAKADTVVYSLGIAPRSREAEAIQAALPPSVPFASIGDCRQTARVGEAVKAGLMAALEWNPLCDIQKREMSAR